MNMEVSKQMRAVFADAWWGERDRRRDAGLPEDNDACDEAGLQAVMDQLWELVPVHLPPEPDSRTRVKFIDRFDREWVRDSGDPEYPWQNGSGTKARWLMVVNAGPLRRVGGRRPRSLPKTLGKRRPLLDPPAGV